MKSTSYPTANAPAAIRGNPMAAADLQWVESLTRLLDSQFRIPGTHIRFGADFLLGLVPGAGSLVSMAFSGLMIATMAKHGASGKLAGRMLINVLLDTLVGSVPVLGNVFDLFYKANVRNLKLMKEHYHEGKHTGSIWPILLLILVVFLVALAILTFVIVLFLRAIWELTSQILN
ncbi:MAG: DUF4112 domain-containing protein [Planctomycetaceae bacterium]